MRLWKKIKAVSPVVGVILMVAITIVLAATIYLWVSSLTSPTKSAPQINFAFSYNKPTTSSTEAYVNLTVVSVQGRATWNNIEITLYVNGTPQTYLKWNITSYTGTSIATNAVSGSFPTKEIHAGDLLWTTVPTKVASSGATIKVQVTYVPSNSVIYTYTYTVP